MMPSLTDRQELFCREYLIDLNVTQAALRAGYSAKAAGRMGRENISKPEIQERIAVLKYEVDAGAVDADYLLKRLVEIDSLDIADVLDDEGNLLPVKQWSMAWRISVSAADVADLKKVKMPDKLKNLELLGKHMDVSAFKERMEVTGRNGADIVIQVRNEELIESLSDNMAALKALLAQ